MGKAKVNGVELFYELSGSGDVPLVFVHGAWSWHSTWNRIVPALSKTLPVLVYDRRGHAQSQHSAGQGVRENVDDLASLIEQLDLAPAWIVGNSSGAAIVLRLAGERPDLFRGLIAHEPPLFSLVGDDASIAPMLEKFNAEIDAILERIESGDHEAAAEQFMEIVMGKGSWAQFSPERRQTYAANAVAFLDQSRDANFLRFDPAWLQGFPHPVLLTQGDQSGPFTAPLYARLAEMLPDVEMRILPGMGHGPHITHPDEYAQVIIEYIQQQA